MVFSLLSRIYYGFIRPPPAHKQDDAIRFGLIGASQIAPIALIAPAKSHPEVIVAAVAARDRDRAASYAKKHDIPIVHASYQALLNDPSIDAVYISLPNSHHYEWALRALKAGKHVLLEKPSTANAAQASALFTHPLATAPNAPVLLEAFHYVFHPAWQTFLALLRDPSAGRIESAFAAQYMPAGLVAPAGDIRWRYDLAGGAMMDFGTYPLHALRQMLGQEPVKGSLGAEARLLDRAKYRGFEREETEVDEYMRAWFRGDGGAEARMEADLSVTGGWPFLPASWTRGLPGMGWPKCEVEMEEREVGEGEFVKRRVTLWNHLGPSIWHRIDVRDTHVVRREGEEVRRWEDGRQIQAYAWPVGDRRAGRAKEWWTTYSYQLEEFVNRVKGREGSGVWIDGRDSVRQMEIVDQVYKQAGLSPRPGTGFTV